MRESKEKQNFPKHVASSLLRAFSKKGSNSKGSTSISQPATEPPSNELILAVKRGELATVKRLLGKRRYDLDQLVRVSSVDRHKGSLLYISVWRRHIEIVRLLLQQGASPNVENEDGNTPFHQSIENKDRKILQLLLDHGADVNLRDKNNLSPLEICMEEKNMELMQVLLEHGANPNVASEMGSGKPLLHHALFMNRIDDYQAVVRLLVKAGADVNSYYDDRTPLVYASWNSDRANGLDIFKLLIEAGANINAQEGCEALWSICSSTSISRNELNIFKLLVEAGANVNLKSEGGVTLLHQVCKKFNTKNLEVIELLLNNGAEPDVEDDEGYTPLYFACEQNNLTAVKRLLPLVKGSLNHATPHGTPLAAACRGGHIQIVKLLLNAGANPKNVKLASKRFSGYIPEVDSLLRAVAIDNDSVGEAEAERRRAEEEAQCQLEATRAEGRRIHEEGQCPKAEAAQKEQEAKSMAKAEVSTKLYPEPKIQIAQADDSEALIRQLEELDTATQKASKIEIPAIHKRYQALEKQAIVVKSTEFYISRARFYELSAEKEANALRQEVLYGNALKDYRIAMNYNPFAEGVAEKIEAIEALMRKHLSAGGFFAPAHLEISRIASNKVPTREELTPEQLKELEEIKERLRQERAVGTNTLNKGN